MAPIYRCECGKPADFFIAPADNLGFTVNHWGACLQHIARALKGSGAYYKGKVIRLTISVQVPNNSHD